MADDSSNGHLTLPEFNNLDLIFRTLVDRANTSGQACLGTFLIRENLAGVMVVGKMDAIINLSRLIATIGSSPLVKMEEKK